MPTTMGLPDLEELIRLLNAGEVTPMGGGAPAAPLPSDPVPGAGMPTLVQPGQAPLDMPGESFDAAPQGGGGGFDWKRLLPLLPLAVAGLKGGMPAMGGFGAGFTRGASVREEQNRLKRAQAAREAAESYAQMRDERQDAQAETEQQMRVLQMMPELADRAVGDAEAAGLDTPELVSQFAERRYADLVAALGTQMPNMDPNVLRSFGGDIRGRVSARLRAKAAPYYDKLTRDADPATLDTLRADTTPRYLGMPFAELERIASAETPPARGKKEKVSFQSKNVRGLLDGKPFEGMADYDPSTPGYSVQGKPLSNVRDAPPAPSVVVQNAGLPTRVQSRVNALVNDYQGESITKSYKKVAESVEFIKSLDVNTKNPADDQALIYAFAKAMDPESVVREGEYATVQKYAQSWADKFGFDAKRVFSNTSFLTPQARANMKKTITGKAESARTQYRAIKAQYVKQINRTTGSGDGAEYLVDYDVLMPESGSSGGPKDGDPVQFQDGSIGVWDAKLGKGVRKR